MDNIVDAKHLHDDGAVKERESQGEEPRSSLDHDQYHSLIGGGKGEWDYADVE